MNRREEKNPCSPRLLAPVLSSEAEWWEGETGNMCIKEPITPPLGCRGTRTSTQIPGAQRHYWADFSGEWGRGLQGACWFVHKGVWLDGPRGVWCLVVSPGPDTTHLTRSGSNCIKLLVYVMMLLQVRDLGSSPRRQALCGTQIIEDEGCRSGPGPAGSEPLSSGYSSCLDVLMVSQEGREVGHAEGNPPNSDPVSAEILGHNWSRS